MVQWLGYFVASTLSAHLRDRKFCMVQSSVLVIIMNQEICTAPPTFMLNVNNSLVHPFAVPCLQTENLLFSVENYTDNADEDGI